MYPQVLLEEALEEKKRLNELRIIHTNQEKQAVAQYPMSVYVLAQFTDVEKNVFVADSFLGHTVT